MFAAAAPAAAATAERYEDGLAAYQRNDFARSLKVLRPLAEKGDARAQYLIGRHYQFGQAVKVDRAEAYYWYKRAEVQGHNEARLFRQLLEKRWKISAAERARGEARLATDKVAKEKAAEVAVAREKAKAPPPAKPKPEIAQKPAPKPEPPKPEVAKAKPEPAKPKPPEKPPIVAARSTPGPDDEPPSVVRGKTPSPRAPAPAVRDVDDDEDEDVARPSGPPPETRTTIAAVPSAPPPTASDYDGPQYSPTPTHPPPSGPYYDAGPGPAPYYAPPAPTWRAGIYYRARPHRPAWSPRPHAGRYVHPGWRGGASWRGAGWRGGFRGGFRGRW